VNAREKSRDGQPSDPRHFARDTCYRTDDLSAARHLKIINSCFLPPGFFGQSGSHGYATFPFD
jgi:hypothetical protein